MCVHACVRTQDEVGGRGQLTMLSNKFICQHHLGKSVLACTQCCGSIWFARSYTRNDVIKQLRSHQ